MAISMYTQAGNGMLTVARVLALPPLQQLVVVAGHKGLSRIVSTVSVMDAPDIDEWMRGGEFLITSAYPIKDDVESMNLLIEKLNASGVAAFGIKEARFIGKLPQSALDIANQLDFPLISIPSCYAFTDIINPILCAINNKQSAMLTKAGEIHTSFLNLAVKGCGADEILSSLSAILMCDTAFIDTYFGKRFYSGQAMKKLESTDISALDQKKPENFTMYPIVKEMTLYGYLLVEKKFLENLEFAQTVIDYAVLVLLLDINTRISNKRIEEKYRNEFVGDLLFNNIKSKIEMHNRADTYGWNLDHGGLAAIIDISDIKRFYPSKHDDRKNGRFESLMHTILEAARKIMNSSFSGLLYYKQSDHFVYIIPTTEKKVKDLYRKLEEVFSQIRSSIIQLSPCAITMAVGTYRKNIVDICESYQEAKTVNNMACKLNMSNSVLFFENLSLVRLLANVRQSEEAKEFLNKYLEPILRHDRENSQDLLVTLQTIVNLGWNIKAASKKLYLHYNTLKYRYIKLGEILGINLNEKANRLNVEIALELLHLGTGSMQ